MKAFFAVGGVSVATFVGAMFGAVVLTSVETSLLGYVLLFSECVGNGCKVCFLLSLLEASYLSWLRP